jgi:hypothetical protein
VCRPFVGNPTPAQWLELIDFIKNVQSTRGIDLVVIDTLSYLCRRGRRTTRGRSWQRSRRSTR